MQRRRLLFLENYKTDTVYVERNGSVTLRLCVTAGITELTECQALNPVVRIGSPSPASECCSPLGPKGRHTHYGEMEREEPNSDDGTD
jgi:hypothetical protein